MMTDIFFSFLSCSCLPYLCRIEQYKAKTHIRITYL